MDTNGTQESAERNELWVSLLALRPEIDRVAKGELDSSDRQRELFVLFARIIANELDFRNLKSRQD